VFIDDIEPRFDPGADLDLDLDLDEAGDAGERALRRANPEPGDFGVVRISGGAGLAIRLAQWLVGDGFATYQHAVVYVGEDRIVEAEPGGAVVAALDRYDGVPIRWSSGLVALTDEQRTLVVEAALGFRGVGYSFADYLAIFSHRFRLPGSSALKQYVATTRHMICSQLVDAAYEAAGVHLFDDGRWHGYVTPGQLARLLERSTVAPNQV
jgi:uncharacterized protein YycO